MTEKETIDLIVRCAKLYRNHLEGKTILFVYEDRNEKKKRNKIKFIETIYYPTNFAHLTGYKAIISSNHFYNRALSKIITNRDLEARDKFLSDKKLKVLTNLMNIDTSARAIGSYDGTIKKKLRTDIVVGNIQYSLGYVIDKETNYYYTPNTALDEDIRNITYVNNRILMSMKKTKKEKKYSEITYIAKGVDLKQILNNKNLKSLIDLKNIYFYNKSNLVNTKIIKNLKNP